MNDLVPNASVVPRCLQKNNHLDQIINMSGKCLNMAMETASSEAQDNNKIFVPQNWIKSKTSLKDIRTAIKNHLSTLSYLPEGQKVVEQLKNDFNMNKDEFQSRWSAD